MVSMIGIFVSIVIIFVSLIAIMNSKLAMLVPKIANLFSKTAPLKFMMPVIEIMISRMKTGAAITISNTTNITLTMSKLIAILAIFISLALTTKAQTAPNVQLINPESVSTPRGYSHAAVIDLGNCKMVIMSGQVALDPKGNLVGANDIAKQTEQVFRNIKNIVEAAGGKMDHLVKLGYFTTDVSRIADVRTIRDQFINTKTPPASTLVQVNKLFREDILIEIEATAVIPKN
jgi:enamine deaminase RidA (YjgF/YER057c/UK114 family)